MGGDAQPQVLLQLLVRMLVLGQDPGAAVAAPRWILSREPTNAFDTWRPPVPEHDARPRPAGPRFSAAPATGLRVTRS